MQLKHRPSALRARGAAAPWPPAARTHGPGKRPPPAGPCEQEVPGSCAFWGFACWRGRQEVLQGSPEQGSRVNYWGDAGQYWGDVGAGRTALTPHLHIAV